MKRILLVEDEPVILKALARLLERNHYEVHCATTVDEALDRQPLSFDLILTDLRLPGDAGTTLIRAAEPVPVIIMTSHASVRSAVDAMRHGAIDYIAKPFDHDELLLIIERSLNQNLMQSQNRALKMNLERLHPVQQHVVGTRLESIHRSICQNVPSHRYLHIFGECGTDKESLANSVHASTQNNDGPFLVLDVAANITDAATLLLGNSQSSQTISDEHGLEQSGLPSGGFVQAAQNGTLVIRFPELLDKATQRALCALVTGSVLNGHSDTRRRSNNMTLINVSTQKVDALLAQGKFTECFAELFAAHQFEVPALRKRPEDIIVLAKRHLSRLETHYAFKRLTLSEDAMAALMGADWPGNVSELESLLERAALQCRTKTITLNDLGISQSGLENKEDTLRDLSLDEYFRFFVIRNQAALSETELASRLGISRKALWERRQKMNLPRDTNDLLSS